MKIIVISDTHGSVSALEMVKKYIQSDVNCIIHAGDVYYFGPRNPLPSGHAPGSLSLQFNSLNIPLICAKGNCDSDVDQLVSNFPLCDPFAFVVYNGIKIFVTHGHRYSNEDLLKLSKQWNINIVVSGHTHMARLEKIDGVIFLNPGSCALPKNFPGMGVIGDRSVELRNLLDGSIVEKISL